MGHILLPLYFFALGAARAEPVFPRPAIPDHVRAPRPLAGRYSLWDGQTAPMTLPQDEVSRLSPQANAPQALAVGNGPSASAGGPGELFVAVELDMNQDQAQLKDALAELSQTAGFHPDARFAPVEAGHDAGMKIFGWLPGSRLGEAARLRSVRQLEIERSATRASGPTDAAVEVLVGVRRAAGLTQAEDDARFSQAMRDLADEAQFRWDNTAGYQSIPGSSDAVLLVVGQVPARLLGRLLAHPDVVKVQPFPGAEPEPLEAPPRSSPLIGRFLSYVLVQSPLLLAATGLLLLPPFRPRLKRLTGRLRG